MKQIIYNGNRYEVINTYCCPFYGEMKAQFYVGNILTTVSAHQSGMPHLLVQANYGDICAA